MEGALLVGPNTDTAVRSVAFAIRATDRPPLTNAGDWPQLLQLNRMALIDGSRALKYLMPDTLWYGRFAGVEGNGREIVDDRLNAVASDLTYMRKCLELPLKKDDEVHSVLWVFPAAVTPDFFVLLYVICPKKLADSEKTDDTTGNITSIQSTKLIQPMFTTLDATGPNYAQGVWLGKLIVRGIFMDVDVSVVGLKYTAHDRLPMESASSWPNILRCDHTTVRPWVSLQMAMHDFGTRVFVRFVSCGS